jgi:hypothetical protein
MGSYVVLVLVSNEAGIAETEMIGVRVPPHGRGGREIGHMAIVASYKTKAACGMQARNRDIG